MYETIDEIKKLPATNEPPADRINIEEASTLTGLSIRELYKQTSGKTIPHGHFGKRLIFSRRELIRWMEDLTIKATVPDEVMTDRLSAIARKKEG
jgi:hypothetical protein